MKKFFKPVFICSNGNVVIGESFKDETLAYFFLDDAFVNDSFIYKNASYDMGNVVTCFIHETT